MKFIDSLQFYMHLGTQRGCTKMSFKGCSSLVAMVTKTAFFCSLDPIFIIKNIAKNVYRSNPK